MSKSNQSPPALGIGEFRGKGVDAKKPAKVGGSGVGPRQASTKNDK